MSKTNDMRVLENGYATLLNGTVIELSGKSLSDIVFVRERDLKEGANVDATKYSQFSVGGRSFTIQNSDQESIDLLKDKAKRKTLSSVKLEATVYDKPELDPESLEPTGNVTAVKAFRFISCTTVDDAKAYLASEGSVAQEEAKWAPKATVSAESINKAITAGINTSMNAFMDAWTKKAAAPAAVPVPEVANAAEAEG